MYSFRDEGFTDGDPPHSPTSVTNSTGTISGPSLPSFHTSKLPTTFPPVAISVKECEDLAFKLLSSLPRSRLAAIQRKLVPLLQFDLVGCLPTELALKIFSYLPANTLLRCAFVSRRWHTLATDQTLWKLMCDARGWKWKTTLQQIQNESYTMDSAVDSDDEGMGASDMEDGEHDMGRVRWSRHSIGSGTEYYHPYSRDGAFNVSSTSSFMNVDSSFMSADVPAGVINSIARSSSQRKGKRVEYGPIRNRHSALPRLQTVTASTPAYSVAKPSYKRLYLTHLKLIKRFLASSYHLSYLQTRGSTTDGHTNTIYCLQLYTYPSTGKQVLFTGSRDKTVREWNLQTRSVERIISGVHTSSVLSICAYNGYLASAGSDRKIAIWDLEKNELVKIIGDHDDSVLCVRMNENRLVSCSKDRTVRTYSFPDLKPQFVLDAHRSAVNAVSISQDLIVSASGDRSIRLWDASTGRLLSTLGNHHTRGIASIDFRPPFVLSGSSDKHLRFFNMNTLQSWSTSPDNHHSFLPSDTEHNHTEDLAAVLPLASTSFPAHAHAGETASGSSSAMDIATVTRLHCQACGSTDVIPSAIHPGGPSSSLNTRLVVGTRPTRGNRMHSDLVRSVALDDEFAVSGSYDMSIKVWDRKTGALVADLTGGHNGRIFCVGFDCTKIVSCGEDQRICVWDFGHEIDASFLDLS